MREITINLTDNGRWEMLVDGVPSPRFTRYMRNLDWIRSWSSAALDLLMLGPARWLAFGVALLLVTGQLTVGASTSSNLHDARVSLHFEPMQYSAETVCRPGRHPCPTDEAISAAQAWEVRRQVLLLYLLGVGTSVCRRLERRLERQ